MWESGTSHMLCRHEKLNFTRSFFKKILQFYYIKEGLHKPPQGCTRSRPYSREWYQLMRYNYYIATIKHDDCLLRPSRKWLILLLARIRTIILIRRIHSSQLLYQISVSTSVLLSYRISKMLFWTFAINFFMTFKLVKRIFSEKH